jgi:crotonobetaine/carnitine-CoA ligase
VRAKERWNRVDLLVSERSVQGLVEAAVRRDPDGPAATFVGDRTYSREEIWRLSRIVGSSFSDHGVKRGDRVMMLLGNRAEFMTSWLGALSIGAISVPLNTAFSGEILANMMRTMTPSVVIAESAMLSNVLSVIDSTEFEGLVVVVGTYEAVDPPPGVTVAGFGELLDNDPLTDLVYSERSDTCAILYTSGTTGPSKGNMWPHGMVLELCKDWAEHVEYGQGDVVYAPGPLFHGLSMVFGFIASMAVGGHCVLPPRFSASSFWRDIHEWQCTRALLIGQMAAILYGCEPTDLEKDNPLKVVFCAPTPTEYYDAFEERFGMRFVEAYGLTDCGLVFWTPEGERNPAAVGKLISTWQADLVDDHDESVPVGEPGELLLRPLKPDIASQGYFCMPDATVELLRNAWYHTGDLFRRDEQGWFYFVDRKKDSLRRGGENISSFEVEEVLLAHPMVLEAAVIAVGSELTEDDVMACLVVTEGASLEEIGDLAESKLPYYAVPRYYDTRDELPKTPTLKVRKVELREEGITSTTWDRGRTRRVRT